MTLTKNLKSVFGIVVLFAFTSAPMVADTMVTSVVNLRRDMFFGLNSNTTGFDSLWTSDGSEDSTEEVADLGGSANFVTDINDDRRTMYFILRITTVNDDGSITLNDALWESDGSDDGTEEVFEFDEGLAVVTDLQDLKRKMYFFVRQTTVNDDGSTTTVDSLWVTDGSDDGTEEIVSLDENAQVVGNLKDNRRTMYFSVRTTTTNDDGTTTSNDALWESDGTEDGTEEVVSFTSNDDDE